MKNRTIIIVAAGFFLSIFIAGIALSVDEGTSLVKYPAGHRRWAHVKSMVIQKGHPLYDAFGGIHHIYANRKAAEAIRSGKPFADGAVLIFDLLEAKMENNAIVEGPRKVIGVMEKDYKKFADTGGWGFEAFKGDTRERAVKDPKNACFSCHEPQKNSDYVYSKYRK